MEDKSLIAKIRQYATDNNSINRPTSEEDWKIFNQIMNKDNIFKHKPLNMADLRQLAKQIQASETTACQEFYMEIAQEMGITCIDSQNTADSEINIQSRTSNETIEINDKQLEIASKGINQDKNTVETNERKYDLIHCSLERNCFGINIKAEAIVFTDGSMLILKGSNISEKESVLKSVKSIRDKHRNKFENGSVTDDILCKTPSNAAVTIVGNSVNGWDEWKDAKGNKLNKYRELIEELDGAPLWQDDDPENSHQRLQEVADLNEAPLRQDGELEDNTERLQGVEGNMQLNTELMPVPKVSLSEESIRKVRGISNESIDKLVEAIKSIKDIPEETDNKQPVKIEIIEQSEEYTEEARNNDVIGISFNKVKTAVTLGMNIIYRGVPGCGKTFAARCDAMALINKKVSNRIKQIDFTENIHYSDTMVGLRQSESGKWRYVKGEIAEFCDFAAQHIDRKFVLILNELTRANTEAVLGQMFTAMENKYRGKEFRLDNGDMFTCPKNLIILATMNGTDKGVKKLDKATEERFYIIDVKPLWDSWANNDDAFDDLVDMLEIKLGTDEYSILKDLCKEVDSINSNFEAGGILTSDSQIGQRQLLQFIGQTDLDNNKIKYNKNTLSIIIEQIISRVGPMVDMQNAIEGNIENLRELVELCNA